MLDKEVYSKYVLGDMTAVYIRDNKNNSIGLTLIPSGMEDDIELDGWWSVEPAVQFKLIGDSYPDGFSHGHTMKNSQSVSELKFVEQTVEHGDIVDHSTVKIITKYERNGVIASHVLEYIPGSVYLTSYTLLESKREEKVGIEMLSSYNISAFPCVGKGLRQEDLVLHRMQSKWSMEGKLESKDFLDLQLEPAWLRIGASSVRFGEVGSMPVRRYFPWMIAEDKKHGYGIGIQICHPASWQMEVYNKDEKNSLSGGLADREFGHWMKYLMPGESFETPHAIITVAKEDVDGISWRLTSAQMDNLNLVPEIEKELPVLFNEFCTTWGNPSEENIFKIVDTLKGHDIKYCVIDAGWHVKDGNDWSDIGDWITNKNKFPNGLKAVADKIREHGMIPGLWYEMEIVGKDSDMFKNENMLLKRDGLPIQTAYRRFLDFRKDEVIDFLTERVIDNLKDNGFEYLKVDYNDNIGIGCEGAESLGEGLRENMAASQEFFRKIRTSIPDIIIENCSSGGHRLEPSMQALTSMASFSDAHEWEAIPVIAANVTRAILPAQSQIWAVLRAKDSEKRLRYSLSNTFLGRMCLSGDIYDLTKEQWAIVDEAIAFYKECAPVIRNGRNYRYGTFENSYNHLKGWQSVCRVSDDENKLLIVTNTFSGDHSKLEIDLPKGATNNWKIERNFSGDYINIMIEDGKLIIDGAQDYDGMVILATGIDLI